MFEHAITSTISLDVTTLFVATTCVPGLLGATWNYRRSLWVRSDGLPP